ncbi:winged helix-turn-helix domain-containing protein [Xanthomonas sacchari]|uniref:winged helix-turn-helix domain-containing protein n=1 Tax=Xanthomonas sacchari TaxID=56458 RepID=UPI0022521EEF|nr:winged helix-turn-helix domain-containing protein [Xanthomonas sacchari]
MNHLPARTTDPLTSWNAAEHVVRSGKAALQQGIAAEAVKANPGHTSAELARYCTLDRYQLARRLPELEEAGRVRRGNSRKCLATGHGATTWWPVA